jgi:hypothetical protein
VDNVADTAKALKNGAEELGSCLVNSFKADTDVETSEGPKDISAIQIGDYVLAWDESSGMVGYYEVTNAFHHTDAVVTEVILSGEWIETTPEHPFYVDGKGWVEAEDLKIGDEVRQADGTTGVVWLKWNVYKTQEMYNLTVDTAHTFFVGEGQWLVHNACDFGLQSDLRKVLDIESGQEAHHLIPWKLRNEPIVQKASEAGFHMNEAYNGLAMTAPHHIGGHPEYTATVLKKLKQLYYPKITAEEAYDAVMYVADSMRNYITQNNIIKLR